MSNTAPIRAFEYEALEPGNDPALAEPRIRLLHLHPNLKADSLMGQIKWRIKGEKYEALSYHWGPEVPSEDQPHIHILDDRGFSILKIQPNLKQALIQLRSNDGNLRPLWIDAVCINQKRNEEKSRQIPLMNYIFQDAKQVCIWLGDKIGDNDYMIVNLIKEIIKLEGIEKLIDPTYTDRWADLASLMGRDWFNRRWVVQEIAFARKAEVYWGTESVEWKALADAISLFGSKAPQIAELFRSTQQHHHRADFLGDVQALSANRLVQTIGKVFRKADTGSHIERLLSLEALISNLSAFNASRPHDIIYAVLSLAKDIITTAKKPDPNKLQVQPNPGGRRHSHSIIIIPPSHTRNPSRTYEHSSQLPIELTDIIPAAASNTLPSPVENGENSLWDALPDVYQDFLDYAQQLDSKFRKEKVDEALTRIALHVQHIKDPFVWEDIQKAMLPGIAITKKFWDNEALRWCKDGSKGKHALVIKLLKYERGLEDTAATFIDTLRGRIKLKTFHVDYEKKFYEVCKDFINFTIKSSKSLDMLCRPWAPDKEDLSEKDSDNAELPSWICPLSKSPFLPRPDGNFGRVNADLLVGHPASGATTYRTASSTVPEQFFFGGHLKRNLFVVGLVIDEIRETATEAVEGNIPNNWLKLGDWEKTDTEPKESFWRTLVADREENGQNPPSYYQRACQIAWAQRVKGGTLNTNQLISSKSGPVMNEYLKRVQAVVWMRKLIRTKFDDSDAKLSTSAEKQNNGVKADKSTTGSPKGRLGLVPPTAVVGDKICMLRGCSVPVVMRMLAPKEISTDQTTQDQVDRMQSQATGAKWERVACKLIGECYVHGIMNGEIFKLRDQLGLLDTIFEIK